MKKIKGFTLVELVIVIAIVIILSVVSVPIYRGYTKQAKMTEGYALLGTILSAQKSYYAQYGYFLHYNQSSSASVPFTSNEEVLGINAGGNKYFTAFCVGWRGDNSMNVFFACDVMLPTEFINGNKSSLSLFYNISRGSTILERNPSV